MLLQSAPVLNSNIFSGKDFCSFRGREHSGFPGEGRNFTFRSLISIKYQFFRGKGGVQNSIGICFPLAPPEFITDQHSCIWHGFLATNRMKHFHILVSEGVLWRSNANYIMTIKCSEGSIHKFVSENKWRLCKREREGELVIKIWNTLHIKEDFFSK